jgi:hypothetical protein
MTRGTKGEHVSAGRQTGTREWAEHTANCCLGCRHDCRYCYARANALRWGWIKSPVEWKTERPNWNQAARHWKKKKGIVMFPTTHDITEGNFDACVSTLINILDAGNRALVVSKPATAIIGSLLETFSG